MNLPHDKATKQWDEITIAEVFKESLEESKKCLELAKQALQRKDELSCKALKDRSDKHGTFYHEIRAFSKKFPPSNSFTVRTLLDAIEADRLSCLELEKKAFQENQAISENAFRRQGNHYELLYQEIMYFVNKICPELN
jgi:hypothetical protein